MPENGWRAAVRPVDLLSDSALIRPLISGLPLRFHFVVELWHDKFFADGLVDRATWSLILFQEPLSGEYRMTYSWDPQAEDWFISLTDAAAALERWYRTPLQAPGGGGGTYYYEASLEVEILSLGDLDELEHWLRGEVGSGDEPGGGGVFGALGRGVKRLFIRLIGLSARKYGARSEPFRP
ncbi:MAG: hypothetical protein GWN99_02430 [Gemmatimonadetes bacterium]|uniref:Uncharacterized protein n=1 Tax=Candidatus Kutchimonas denitrificans TaxID=3056748 RepID=A0AAE4Z9U7_9BACT|nr:hypothetical protein [Gemmatimonadota bacterium]NIR74811.1 hypothetical protein [Candidatus Kutchimonas denitrificans]NIR99922.1 hypothetical protein [Gemmatimonadota bacterium]NIT65506.1 hypothetical protein [Gemmatimonadota bacterium]NIU52476.1 hypothetical protein [Gemmatimonadota bacterium]